MLIPIYIEDSAIKDNAFRTPYSKETYEMLKSCIDKI